MSQLAGEIQEPYLLIIHIPTYLGTDGRRLVDELWQKDLMEHLVYLPRFMMAAPLASGPPPERALALPDGGITYINLTNPRGRFRSWLGLPVDVLRLWHAIGRTKVVHVGVAGWPYSLGWFASPFAKLRRRFLVIVVESTPWRIPSSEQSRVGPVRRLRAAVWERLARWCVGLADASFFTQAEYRSDFLRPGQEGHVIPASWIDERVILSVSEAESLWQERLSSPDRPLQLAFVGRLATLKGIPTLLEAMARLDADGVRVNLDIFGAGELEGECARAALELRNGVTLRLCGTLPYGDDFFRGLRPYHAVVVPSLSDEQPRIIFDVFSQALPVLGSDTAGIREVVTDGLDGWLVPPGDAKALAELIRRTAADPRPTREFGLAGLAKARSLTHQEMHRQRCRLIRAALDQSATS
jgi:glycosyltransferase involved in cell wall biosynthesis